MRKYNFVFAECPIEGCETPLTNYASTMLHFKHHIAWEETQGCVVLFNREGTVKAFLREKA